MTLATLDPASGNQTGVWIVLALLAVLAICACLYQHERRSDRHGRTLTAHDRQLAGLAYEVGSLKAEAATRTPTSNEVGAAQTDEIPAQPGLPTEPMAVVDPTPAVQARRDAAWDQQRPSPVPRGIEYVERTVNIGGTLQTYRIPAKREEAS